MKNSSLDPNSQDDHYMVCDIEFEECLINGATLYKCSTCGKLFTETLLLIDHYSSNHVSKITDLKEVEVTDVIDVCNFTKINDVTEVANVTKVRNVTKVSEVTKINNVTEVTNVTKNNDETKVTDKVETVNSFYRAGSVVATENVQSSTKDKILVNEVLDEYDSINNVIEITEVTKISDVTEVTDITKINNFPKVTETIETVNKVKKVGLVVATESGQKCILTESRNAKNSIFVNIVENEVVDEDVCVCAFKCRICYAEFPKMHDMSEHISAVHDGKKYISVNGVRKCTWLPYKCTICQIALETTQEIDKHITLAHNIAKFYLCNICFVYFTKDNLKPHKKAAHDGLMLSLGNKKLDFETENNKFQVQTAENMKIQKKRKDFDNQSPHIKEIPSPVHEVKKSKKDTEGITTDILKPKPDEAKFNLEICEEIDLIEIAWVFKCVLCHAVFEERNDMIEHNIKVHEGFYKTRHFFVFKCTMCPKEFKKEFDIVRHVKLVHKVEIIETDIADLSKTDIEKYVEDDGQRNIESTEMFKDENNILQVTKQEMAVINVTPIRNGFNIVPATIN